jgi:ATP-dependent DNA helicase RecG
LPYVAQGGRSSLHGDFIAIRHEIDFCPCLSAGENFFRVELGLSHVPAGAESALSRHQVGTKSELSPEQKEALINCKKPRSLSELSEILKRSNRTKLKQTVLTPLLEAGLLAMTYPDKPNSPKQKYVMTPQGKELLEQITDDSIE